MRAEAKKPIKSRKTGAKLYASTASKPLVALPSSQRDNFIIPDTFKAQGLYGLWAFCFSVNIPRHNVQSDALKAPEDYAVFGNFNITQIPAAFINIACPNRRFDKKHA